MTHTRPLQSWARLTAPRIPAFTVIRRSLRVNFDTVLGVGAAYPAPEPGNFAQVRRARQLYQQRRIAPAQPESPRSGPSAQSVEDISASPSLLPDEGSTGLPAEGVIEDAEDRDQQDKSHHNRRKGKQSHGS
jgi:hypothetical protein